MLRARVRDSLITCMRYKLTRISDDLRTIVCVMYIDNGSPSASDNLYSRIQRGLVQLQIECLHSLIYVVILQPHGTVYA